MCCADKRPSWRVLSETADSSRPLRKAPIGLFSSYSSLDPRTAQDEKETQLRALNWAVLLDLIASNILKSRGGDSVVVMPLGAWSPVLYTTPRGLIYRNFWTNLVHSVGQKPDASVCDAACVFYLVFNELNIERIWNNRTHTVHTNKTKMYCENSL